MEPKGLKIVKGCGGISRTIYIIDGSDEIQIGCTLYTKQDAINSIEYDYHGQTQLDYINKVNECYNSDITPWSILKDDVDCDVRLEVAKHGQYLEQFKDDVDLRIRMVVAMQGKYLEQLKDDSIWRVRIEVAKHGQYLDQIKDDAHWIVRREVAKQGKYLEQLKDDENYDVRLEVAKHGKYLDQLKDDENFLVRREVAKQGQYLEQLKDDEDWRVREMALEMLKKQITMEPKGLKIVKGCGYQNRTIYIIDGSDEIQIGCTSYTQQDAIKAIEDSYEGQDQLDYINKVNECYNSDVTPWSILKDDVDWRVRREVAKHGQCLEQLKDVEDWLVRREVARQGKLSRTT